MSLSGASSALGVPEPLVQRAAAARASASGTSVDAVLSAWAGGAAIEPTTAAAAAAAPPSPPVGALDDTGPTAETGSTSVAVTPVAVPVAAGAGAATRAPVPDEVTPGQAAHLPEVITVPTAGIRERTNFVIPKWLTAVLLLIPAMALFALGGSATGECGSATELQTDVVTGEIVNCDGSEFTGQSTGGGGANFLALGRDVYSGSAVAGITCAGCHGASGAGAGSFPALTGVMTTFAACADHIEWVQLGSEGFKAAGRTTYGDTDKTINGGMPAFQASLTPEQLAAVVAFERVTFGGGIEEEVLVDCGLVDESEGGATSTTIPADVAAGRRG